jgi:hypothetical protein
MNSIAGLDTSHTYSKGLADTLVYNINGPAMDVAQKMAVFGKDDDGNVAGDTFWLYPDAPPVAPVVVAQKVGSQEKLSWVEMDTKDNVQTLYKILLRKRIGSEALPPSLNETTDTLVQYKAGTLYNPGTGPNYNFNYSFTPAGGAGQYFVQVLAKDARTTVSKSVVGLFSF